MKNIGSHPEMHEMKNGKEDWSISCDYYCTQGYPHPMKFIKVVIKDE